MTKPRTRKPKSEAQATDGVEGVETQNADISTETQGADVPTGVNETETVPSKQPVSENVTSSDEAALEGAAAESTSETETSEEAAPEADPMEVQTVPTLETSGEEAGEEPSSEQAYPHDRPSETAQSAPQPPEPRVIEVRRAGTLPLIFGGILAAVIGAGAVIVAIPNLPPSLSGWLPAAKTPQISDEMDAKFAAQAKKIDALSSDLAALKSQAAPAPDMSGVQTSLDQIGSEVRANKSALEALQSQVKGIGASGGAADAETQAKFEAEAKAAQERIAQAEQQAQKLRDQSEAAAKAAMAQAAAARMKAALDAGVPLAPARADLQAAGIAVPEALSGDVPTQQALQQSFPDAARKALAAARKADSGSSFASKLGAFLLTETGARSLTARQGDSADAVLSRAQADVDTGDLKPALAEIAKLPDAAQPMMADWVAQAKARVAALDAASQLGQNQ
ncbi:hypothetical protein DL1_11545 [Thioclava dalianensis]|uniref:Mitochondrial inner membrane protein n=1 Tax=Thioclava dalianensis TaxID=1185766 RepID=A0A074T9X4_9RHOB|nr:hypothetical protein [Thioclava dalianensis]KEP68499.1 hypothetical protein DL1_11545 [Thioclava dalianensis]SFN34474.1 hypothetical protein SAMN05216224_104223 [Thioclava dalianensis]